MDEEPVFWKTVLSPENWLAWRRYFNGTSLYMDILKGLKACGAKLSEEDKAEALDFFEKIKKFPAVMQPAKADMDAISDFIKNW